MENISIAKNRLCKRDSKGTSLGKANVGFHLERLRTIVTLTVLFMWGSTSFCHQDEIVKHLGWSCEVFFLFFWLHDMWILVPDQWWNSCPLQWKRRVLGKSLEWEVSLILFWGKGQLLPTRCVTSGQAKFFLWKSILFSFRKKTSHEFGLENRISRDLFS